MKLLAALNYWLMCDSPTRYADASWRQQPKSSEVLFLVLNWQVSPSLGLSSYVEAEVTPPSASSFHAYTALSSINSLSCRLLHSAHLIADQL